MDGPLTDLESPWGPTRFAHMAASSRKATFTPRRHDEPLIFRYFSIALKLNIDTKHYTLFYVLQFHVQLYV